MENLSVFSRMVMFRRIMLAVRITACAFALSLFGVAEASDVPRRTVTNVEVTSGYSAGEQFYQDGDQIEVTVTFSGGIWVHGYTSLGRTQPYIELKIGSKTVRAYNDGTPSDYTDTNRTMVFRYEVPEGLYDLDGIDIIGNSLNDGERNITSIGSCTSRGCSLGGGANLSHSAQGPLSSHKVLADGALRFASLPSTVSDSESISGRLEIFDETNSTNNEYIWSWICDDNFGEDEAKVACNQMGYEVDNADVWVPPDGWADTTTPTYTGLAALAELIYLGILLQMPALLDEVDCPYQESCPYTITRIGCERSYQATLLDCNHDGRKQSDCALSEAVGVTCQKE